ncbi:MAG: hypothetical protein R3D89_03975 [Sphingomonadaceae bacterium]
MSDLYRTLSLLLVILVLGGCVWRGYKPPIEMVQIEGEDRCPSIGTQNLSEADSTALIESVSASCRVIHSQSFFNEMAGLTLRDRCKGGAEVSGSEVVRMLREKLPDYSVVVRKPWMAEAVTDAHNARIAIRRKRIEAWEAGAPRSAALIDTTVHEWTHLFLTSERNVRFMDDGHSKDPSSACANEKLVSYKTGQIAAQVFMSGDF